MFQRNWMCDFWKNGMRSFNLCLWYSMRQYLWWTFYYMLRVYKQFRITGIHLCKSIQQMRERQRKKLDKPTSRLLADIFNTSSDDEIEQKWYLLFTITFSLTIVKQQALPISGNKLITICDCRSFLWGSWI